MPLKWDGLTIRPTISSSTRFRPNSHSHPQVSFIAVAVSLGPFHRPSSSRSHALAYFQ